MNCLSKRNCSNSVPKSKKVYVSPTALAEKFTHVNLCIMSKYVKYRGNVSPLTFPKFQYRVTVGWVPVIIQREIF